MKSTHPNQSSGLILILVTLLLFTTPHHSYAQEAPFHRGVNLTNWFQAPSARQMQFTRYTRQDFINIQSLGFDVIRLPINLHFMTGGAPDYILDPLFLEFLDQAVNWAEELGIHLILDNHTFSPSEDTDPDVGKVLRAVWRQMATHYSGRSDRLYYEVLNEPHGISDALWNSIQQSVVDEIRLHDTTHYIVVGPAGWNSYNNLSAMPPYEDPKLIYTFHFYDPFLFTHQGATWVSPSMIDVLDIPFPFDAASMPSMPPGLSGSWVGGLYGTYPSDGTVQKVKQLIDIAVQFRQQRGVPLFCGEFGVYQPNSQEVHRVTWYEEVRKYLESNQIAWTMWDYHGGFGLFEEDGNGLFDHDLNVPLLESLGMDIPEQTDYKVIPDSLGFNIYDDYLAQSFLEASYTDGLLDYFSADHPNNGHYCIHWTGAGQYQAIALDLRPDRDLTRLVREDFALDLMVRGSDPGISFDIRFLDSKTADPADLPWRMGITIDRLMTVFDGNWHHLHIPLKEMREKGAWYNNTWHDPPGDFHWSEVDRLEIVPEAKALGSAHLYFDNLHITDMDTAQVNTDTTTGPLSSQIPEMDPSPAQAFPNPCHGELTITSADQKPLEYHLWDLNGREVLNGSFSKNTSLGMNFLQDGIYILQLGNEAGRKDQRKIILQKR